MQLCPLSRPLPHSSDGHQLLVCPLSISCLMFNSTYCAQIITQILAVPSTPQLAAIPWLPNGYPVDP
jgi:hypothetical protein